MADISEAKRHLSALYRNKEGFVGVGIGQSAGKACLRVFVADAGAPVARQLKSEGEFEGFPVEIEVSGEVRASFS